MLIMEFVDHCANPENLNISIYDAEAGDVVWQGTADGIPGCFEDQSMEGFDAPENNTITINIHGVKPWPLWTYRDGKACKSPWP